MVSPLYIDPGTGSMLFSIVVGAAATLYFLARAAFIKLKMLFSGGKAVIGVKNKYVIYGEDKRYFSLFENILKEFEKRQVPVLYLTSSEDDECFKRDYKFVKTEFIGTGNKAFARLNFLSADIVLSTTPSLGVFQWKRSKTVKHYSHVMHSAGGITLYRLFGIDYYDSVLLSGEAEIPEVRELEKLRNLPEKEIVVVGCPYLDRYLEELKHISIKDKDRNCILISPSWGKSGLLNVCGEELIDDLLNSQKTIIVRPHPQSRIVEKEMLNRFEEKYKEYARVEWDYNPDNIYSLVRASTMFSDFSGIIFDYAFLFGRTVLYKSANMDLRQYDAFWLKEEPIYLRSLPMVASELDAGKNLFKANRAMVDSRKKAKEMFWANIGNSAKTVVDFMIAKAEQLEKEQK